MVFNLTKQWVESHPYTLASFPNLQNTLVVMVEGRLIYMSEVINFNSNHILTLKERMALHGRGGRLVV